MTRGVRNGVAIAAGALLAAAVFTGIGEAQGQGLEVLRSAELLHDRGRRRKRWRQVGDDGVVVVDAGSAASADALLPRSGRSHPAPEFAT
jgi:hypothetical protein